MAKHSFDRLLERGIEQFDYMIAENERAKENAASESEKQSEKPTIYIQLQGPYGQSEHYNIAPLPERYPFDWLVNFAAAWTLHPIKTFSRGFAWPRKAWKFLHAHAGGFVCRDVYDERQAVCGKCPKLDIVIKDGTEHRYCRQCGCGHHRFARLTHKNRLVKWYCPLRKHPGPYPDDAARLYLTEAGYATQEELDGKAGGNRKSGGCGNCGGSDSAGNGKAGHEMAASTAGQEG